MIIWFYISQCFSDLLFLTPEKLSRSPKTLLILSETNPSRTAGEEIVISPYLYLLSTKTGVGSDCANQLCDKALEIWNIDLSNLQKKK
jgi:hypothetical protein